MQSHHKLIDLNANHHILYCSLLFPPAVKWRVLPGHTPCLTGGALCPNNMQLLHCEYDETMDSFSSKLSFVFVFSFSGMVFGTVGSANKHLLSDY